MGLKDYRKFKREQELKESELISSLLHRIELLEKKVELLENREVVPPKVHLSEEEKKKLKVIQDGKTKPEDFVKLFTGDIEEFNPNA